MYCPECGGEYREGFLECADCGVALVAEPPVPPAAGPEPELVTVLETGDPTLLAVAESLLLEAGIAYVKKGESLQDLFALGRLAFGFNPITGPIALQVADADADAAARLLEDLEEHAEAAAAAEDRSSDAEDLSSGSEDVSSGSEDRSSTSENRSFNPEDRSSKPEDSS